MADNKDISIRGLMRKPKVASVDATLYDILSQMIGERTNALLVVDSQGCVKGMVNAVDVIRAIIPEYLDETSDIAAKFATETVLKQEVERARDLKVCDFMSDDVPTINPDAHLLEAAVLAVKKNHGRIVVVDENRHPLGILTRTEIKQVIGTYLNIDGCFTP